MPYSPGALITLLAHYWCCLDENKMPRIGHCDGEQQSGYTDPLVMPHTGYTSDKRGAARIKADLDAALAALGRGAPWALLYYGNGRTRDEWEAWAHSGVVGDRRRSRSLRQLRRLRRRDRGQLRTEVIGYLYRMAEHLGWRPR